MNVPADFGISDDELAELVIPNDLHAAKDAEQCILRELRQHRYGEKDSFAIKLALEEALTNAIKHGNQNDRSRTLIIRYVVKSDRTVIAVCDEGQGFQPETLPDPTADENLERPNGRGIMLMYAYMTKVRFNDRGNEVWMLKVVDR